MSVRIRDRKREPVARKRPRPLSGPNWHVVQVGGELRPARLSAKLMMAKPKGSIAVFMLQRQPCYLLRELRTFVRRLERAVGQRDAHAVIAEAADVANLALMVADAADHV